jgi:hypothetical protein
VISVRSDIKTKWPQGRRAFFLAINIMRQFRKLATDMTHPATNNQLFVKIWNEENV